MTWALVGNETMTMTGSVYIGLAVTSHNNPTLSTAALDGVAVSAMMTSATPPPTSSISFSNKTLVKGGATAGTAYGIDGFGYPTSLERGPDDKLYVATMMGQIYVLTLDQDKLTQPTQIAVTSAQMLDQIASKPTRTCNIGGDPSNCQFVAGSPYGRQVTGLVVGPESTTSQVALYVSHSDPRYGTNNDAAALAIDTYSGAVTKLTLQPNTGTVDPNDYTVVGNQDLVVGLPRSRENHSVNGMDFGPDGWLYVSSPGNTNYGQPSTFFSNLPEYYLSAAVVRLNVNGLDAASLPLDLKSVRTAADMTPFNGKFELFATGFRNGYDIVWHSNGRLYLNDNAGNDGLGNTPGGSDGCPTPSINPGTLSDHLHAVAQDSYGGHPNPARGQCVLNDGKDYTPNLTPVPNYSAPLLHYNDGTSTVGITEYTSNAFGGQLKGNLISATYAGDQNVRRVVLNSTGTAATQEIKLGAFIQPLDVTTDGAGNIYVAELGASQITLMIPDETAICNDPNKIDDDSDGYSDADEKANATDPCSRSSYPQDFDNDLVSNLNDADDDNDGISDGQDQLFFDAQNGSATKLPLALEWNPGDLPLGNVAKTGFTGTHIASYGLRTNTAGISVGAAGGYMALPTASGTAEGIANNHVNALQIGFDSSTAFRIWGRLVEPFNSSAPAAGHVGGIFFGPDEDNFIRLALMGAADGVQMLQVGIEQAGGFSPKAAVNLGTTKIINLDLYLVGDAAAKTVTAYYVLNSTGANPSVIALGAAITVPVGWFSDNAGAAKNTSLSGVMVSDGGAIKTTFVYDFFRIDRVAGATPPTTSVQRISAGGTEYIDGSGTTWVADKWFQNGSIYAPGELNTVDIQNTTDDQLYRSERYGGAANTPPLSYSIPVPNGTYTVRLHFAEAWHGVSNSGGAGARVFDVHVENVLALDDYDIYAKAGGALKATVEEITTSVTDGVLNISLAASVDNAKINAIEVVPTPPTTSSP